MRLTTATGYGTAELVAPLPMPKRAATGLALPVERALVGRRQTTAVAAPHPGATSTASSLLTLSSDARREARNDLWALAVLWTAGWLALVLALTL